MKKIKFGLAFLAVGLVVCFGGGTIKVFAEGSNSSTMVVSPMTQKLILLPGESTTASVNVSNPNDAVSDMSYSVHIGSFSQVKDGDSKDDYGTVDTEIVSNYNMMMDWIVLDKDSGVVAPNEVDTIRFTINVPEDAPAGGQYATILIKDETQRTGEGGGNVSIHSITQVASIIYAEVVGETRNEGQILDNNIPGLVLSNPLVASSMVRNDGNVHTNAKYTLQVWPMFGDEEICTNEEKPTESLVMPETSKFHTEECPLPSVGIFRVKQTVRIFGEESVLERTVIMCPLWLILVVLGAIVGIILWIRSKVKAHSKTRK